MFDKEEVLKALEEKMDYFESENFHSENAMIQDFYEIIENFGDNWEENCSELIQQILRMSPY